MAVATEQGTGWCLGCGRQVTTDDAFCPGCGTRQVPDRPMPAVEVDGETERLGRSATAWLATAIIAGTVLLLVAGVAVGWLAAAVSGDGGDGDDGASDGRDAADSMDAYSPIAESWAEKHDHVADEASGDDPNGLATAAADARIWIDVNDEDLIGVAAGAEGDSAPLFQQLVAIFEERSVVLADVEATATSGGVGAGAASDELAELEALDQRADATTCEIAGVMRAQGHDPDDHITPEMAVDC